MEYRDTCDEFISKDRFLDILLSINPLNARAALIETSQLICRANQLFGFCMRATLAFNGLIQHS